MKHLGTAVSLIVLLAGCLAFADGPTDAPLANNDAPMNAGQHDVGAEKPQHCAAQPEATPSQGVNDSKVFKDQAVERSGDVRFPRRSKPRGWQ
jgi:hypothetical protein